MRHLAIGLFFTCFLANASFAAEEWLKGRPASTDIKSDWPAASQANNDSLDRLLANYQQGMSLTYSSGSTIVVTAGSVTCSNSAGTVRHMRQNTSSTNVTFSDLDTGAEASNTTYYVYANCDADATTATFKISASSTSPTGITSYKRLGNFLNDSSSNITTIDNDPQPNEKNTWSSKSVGTTYQATTDGTVCATIVADSSSASGYLTGYTDSSSSPSTIHGYAACDENGQADHTAYANSFCMPVKAGDYYKVTQTNFGGASTSGSAGMYFLTTQ